MFKSQTAEYRRAKYAANKERYRVLRKARYERNKEKLRAQSRISSKRYYEKHREERKRVTTERRRKLHPSIPRGWKLKWKYGITLAQYDQMVEAQGGVCKICKKRERRLVVDHDHETGKVRGLLCDTCNLALNKYVTLEWLDSCRLYLLAGS